MEPTAALALSATRALDTTLARARRRWRLRAALLGVTIVVGATLIALVASAWLLDRSRFADGAVLAARLFVWAVAIGTTARFLVRPLTRRLSDDRIALYVERHEPSFDAALLSALEARRQPDASAGLARELTLQAAARAKGAEYGARVERDVVRRRGAAALGTVAVAALFLAL